MQILPSILPADGRDYTIAAHMLTDIGVDTVRLMTNNPDKVEQLVRHGINVVDRVEHKAGIVLRKQRLPANKSDCECVTFYQSEVDAHGRSHFDGRPPHPTGRGEESE